MATQGMSPAIIHAASFDSNASRMRSGSDDRRNGNRNGGRTGSSSNGCGRMAGSGDMMSAVEAGSSGSALANAFLVTEFELSLEEGQRPFIAGAEAEFLSGCRKKAIFSIMARVKVIMVMSAISTTLPSVATR